MTMAKTRSCLLVVGWSESGVEKAAPAPTTLGCGCFQACGPFRAPNGCGEGGRLRIGCRWQGDALAQSVSGG